MENTSGSIFPQEIDNSIINNVSHLDENDNGLNNLSNQAKILDYYKPKPSEEDLIVRKVGKYSTQPKTKNETQSILEDVCNDFESIDVTPLKNGPTAKTINHSTPVNISENSRKQESCYVPSGEELLVKGNDSQMSLVLECKEFKPCEYQDGYVINVTPTDLQKFCTLPLEKSSEQVQSTASFDLSLTSVDCAISASSVNHSISLGSADHVLSKKLCNIIPHISNMDAERECENIVSSCFTVTDNVVLKNSDGQDIEFGDYYIQEDSHTVCLENETTIDDDDDDDDDAKTLSPNDDQNTFDNSHDELESISISSKAASTEREQDFEGNTNVSPCVKNARARRISAKMKKQWAKEISSSGHLVCPMPGCHQKYVTVANFQTHYKWCTGKKTLQHCPYCDSLIFTGVEAVLHHMIVEHPEKVDEYKEKCTNEDANLPGETENIVITKRKYKIKSVKKRGFTLKENNLARKNIFKRDLKSVEETMDRNFSEFKKCVRFNDIVQKINSVNDGVNKKVELKNPRKFSRFSKNIKTHSYFENDVDQIDSCNDSDEETVDCPSDTAEGDEKPPRRITTKSRIVLNTQGYKRFNEYLTLTRDWASERKTYSRNKSSDFSYLSSSNDTNFSLDNIQDTYQLNESSEPTGISLSVHDDEYSKEDMIALESSLMGSSIKKVSDKVIEISHKITLKPKSLIEDQSASSVQDEVNGSVFINTNLEDKARMYRERDKPALTPDPAAEVNYGHLIFAQPSKISRKERATCYDNVINKSHVNSRTNQRFDRFAQKKSFKMQKQRKEAITVSDVNKDFDNLIKTFAPQPKRKRGRPPKNIQLPPKSLKFSSLKEVKHSKEDGVKLPTDLKVSSIKKKRGRPPKYVNLEKINPISGLKIKKDRLKKRIIQSTPIVYNESMKKRSDFGDENNEIPPLEFSSPHKINPQICSNFTMNVPREMISTSNKGDIPNSSPRVQNLVSNNHIVAEINDMKDAQSKEFLSVQKPTIKSHVPKLGVLAAAALKSIICTPQSTSSLAVLGKNISYIHKHFESISVQNNIPINKLSTEENIFEGFEKTCKSFCNSFINGSSSEIKDIISNIIAKIESSLKCISAVQNFELTKSKDVLPFDNETDQPSNTYDCQFSKEVCVNDTHVCNDLDVSNTTDDLEFSSSIKKSKLLSPDASVQHYLTLPESNILVANEISVADSKRKRGRPQGVFKTVKKLSKNSPNCSTVTSNEEFVKRKRGRPRKNPCSLELFKNVYQVNTQNSVISDEHHTHTQTFHLACKTQCTEINATKNEIDHKFTSPNEIQNISNNLDINLVANTLSQSYVPHNDINTVNMGTNKGSTLKLSPNEAFNKNETAINVRKSSRVRKLKFDPDTVFLQPKKISRCDRHQTSHQIVRKTGKRGRPRKIAMNISFEPLSSSKANLKACISGIPLSRNGDLNSSHIRKGSRKGRPRKCVRYVDLNSGIDSRESVDYSTAQSIQFIPDAKCAESEKKVFEDGKYAVNCLSIESKPGSVKSKSASEVTPESNNVLNSSGNNDFITKPVNLLKLKEKHVSGLRIGDKSPRLYKKKFKHDLYHKYKSKDVSHKNKIKLHTRKMICSSTQNKTPENIDSPEGISVVDTAKTIHANQVVLDCKSDSQESSSVIQTSASRKTRLAAIKAQRLLGDILDAERGDILAENLNDKEVQKDSTFVPEAFVECQSEISEDEKNGIEKEFCKYKDHVECPEITKRVATKIMINSWFLELEREGRVVCKTQGCGKSLGTVPGMIYHYEVACQKKFLLWRCLYCEKKFKPNSQTLLRHMKKLHFPSEESQACHNRKKNEKSVSNSADTLSHVKKFFEQNQNVDLMKTLKPRISQWKFLDCCEEFLSHFFKTSLMMKVQSVSSKQSSSNWFNLPYFRSSFGKTGDNYVSFYAGGSITCSAWCPTPYTSEVPQYVCLATSEEFINCCDDIAADKTTQDKTEGLLQFWNVGSLNTSELTESPVLDLAIAHKHGRIRSMAWCPQGCYDYPSSFVDTSGDFFPRLGLLATACSDALIRVYSIPHPQYLRCASENLPFYTAEPAILLNSRSNELNTAAVCTSVCWQRTDQSGIIMGGYNNGFVSLWDISSFDKDQNSVLCINPYLTFKAHSAPVTSVAFAPFSSTQWAATGSLNRLLRIWDLTDTRIPVQEFKKGSVKSIKWPLLWSGVFVSFDEGLNTKGSAYVDLGSLRFLRSLSSNNHNTCECASDFSEWLNTSIVGDAFGSVSVSTLQRLNSRHTGHSKFLSSYPIIRTEVVSLEEDNELHSAFEKCDIAAVSEISMHPSSICTEKVIQTKLACDEKQLMSINANKDINLDDFQVLSAELCNSTCRACSKCSKCPKTFQNDATEDNVLNCAPKLTLNCHANESCQCECAHTDHKFEVSKVLDSVISSIQSSLSSTTKTVSEDVNTKNTVDSHKRLYALSKRLGLKFIVTDLTDVQNEKLNVCNSENKCSISSCVDGFHLTSIDYVQFNPNYGSHSWLFIVGQSGIVQILNVGGLQQKEKDNQQ